MCTMIRTIAAICSSTSSQGPQEGIDHLFLLPERVLGMDGAQLRKDLAALDFKVQLLQSAPSGNVWLSGGESGHEVIGQLPNDHNTSSSQPNAKSHSFSRTDFYWFAQGGDYDIEAKDGLTQQQLDREERLKIIKEKQNEERQKKLEELKQQALAAQKYREKTEEDRRRRIEDLRCRENDRRHQVEERKRLIMEAERDRREAILRRNMEREARIESKRKMERSSIVFAFGSSTPRMLEPTDSGSTYWASRRATSTTNVMSMSVANPGPLTRRSSERELANGNKKRATSAGGLLDRKNADDHRPMDSIREVLYWDGYFPSLYSKPSLLSTVNNYSACSNKDLFVFVGEGKENVDTGTTLGQQRSAGSAARRKTDLMPTVPSSSRDMALLSSASVSRNSSVCSSRRSPGRAFSMTRLDQLSQPRARKAGAAAVGELQPQPHSKGLNETDVDMSKSMTHLAAAAAAHGVGRAGGGGVAGEKRLKRGAATSKSMVHLGPPRMTRAERLRKLARDGNATCPTPTSAKLRATSPPGSRSGETTPRPQSALSQHSGSSSVSGTPRPRPSTAPPRKQRPISIAVTGVTSNIDPVKQVGNGGKSPLVENRTPIPKVHVTKKSTSKADSGRKTEKPKSSKSSVNTTPKETPLQSPTMELSTESSFSGSESGDRMNTSSSKTEMTTSVSNLVEKQRPPLVTVESAAAEPKSDEFASSDGVSDLAECDMTGSMTSSQIKRITTEEEAKAALAERRRLAREQAEREAELEQQRLEAERRAEEERLRREEEEQRKMEEEQLRMLEEAKRAEEERLSQAIEEKKKREEEERLKKEEELKLKLEKEEADKKAKEEAEKLRQEMEIKLKKEEEDRQARRKRVEAIMSRTRAKGGTPSVTPSKDNGNDVTDEKLNGMNNNKVISDSCSNNSFSENDQFLAAERNENISSDSTTNPKQNGVHHTVESRNVTNNLLDLTDFDVINTNMIPSSTVSPQIIDLAVSKENYNSNQQDIPDLLS